MYGQRPPTGSGANRPMSSSRARNEVTSPNGVKPLVSQTAARPQTGLKGAAQSGRRVVQDSTFYCNEIRQKINLVNKELSTLQSQSDSITRDNTNVASFEKRADILGEELRELQGKLGDYNTLVDRLHVDAELDDIKNLSAQIHEKNISENKSLDDVFSTRQRREIEVRELEKAIAQEHKKRDALVQNMPDESKAKYNTWKQENSTFLKTIAIQQKELDELNARVAAVGKEIKKDPLKMQSLALHEKKFELNGIKKGITDDIEAFNKESGPVDKARLLEQVKEDNIEIIAMESKITELEAQSVKLTDQIKQMEKELDSSKQSGILYTYTEKNSKFEELLRRDKEMTLFLDNFESRMAESTNRNTETQESIVSLLQKIDELSKLDVQNLPSAKEVQELKGDVNFKEKELKNSENTAEGLLAERERRLKDLEKVQQLEAKIDTELNQLREKKLNLITEMKKVGNIEQVRKETEELKMKNINDRDKLKAERESLTASVAALSSKYDAKTAELNDNETYTLLASLEQKIKHISSNNDRLNETLASKMAESDYKTIAAAALKLGDEVNHQLISMLRI